MHTDTHHTDIGRAEADHAETAGIRLTANPDLGSSFATPVVAPQRITVFGATGGVGRAFVEQAVEAGYAVTALVRDAARFGSAPAGVRLVEGDVRDPEATQRALVGADAVFCALGAPALSGSRVRSEGTARVIAAMRAAGCRRLIAVSLLGAHETRAHLPFALRYLMFPLYLRWAAADHERQEDLIAASDLEWTIVRPPHLDDGPRTGAYTTDFGLDFSGITMRISRADVAHYALHALRSGADPGGRVGISHRR